MTINSRQPSPTNAFMAQAAISFGVSTIALGLGIAYLPVSSWTRAFLAIGALYAVTSTFTLAKCVRDLQEATRVTERIEQARVDKLLAEQDPFGSAAPL